MAVDIREKLVELLTEITYDPKLEFYDLWDMRSGVEDIVDLLIAHGVTAQEWISVKDRLPERFENVLCYFPEKDYGSAVMVDYNESTKEEITVFASQFKWGKVTHWMPLPQPPKGE